MALCSYILPYWLMVLSLCFTISISSPTQHRADLVVPATSLSLHQPGAHRLYSISTAPIRPSSPRRKTLLIPRADWTLSYGDDGWALWFASQDSFGYIMNSAGVLQVFFSTIKHNALSIWATAALPMKTFNLEWGQIVLEFTCELEISWNIVAAFAEQMANKAARGFGGTFVAMLEHTISGSIVYAKLFRRPDIATAAR